MLRPLVHTFWLSSLLLATGSSLASAQGVEVTRDSTSDSAPTASAQRQGRNWFVSLLRKGGRRNDDTVATPGLTTAAPVDTESASAGGSVVPESAVPARRVERSFKSRKDSLEWRSARNVAMRASGYRIIVDLF